MQNMKKNKYKEFLSIGLMSLAPLALIGGVVSYEFMQNSPSHVQHLLENEGYHEVKVGRYLWWCSEDNTIRRHFEALNDKNEAVKGEVCGNTFFTSHVHNFWGGAIDTEIIQKPKMK